MNKLPPSKQCLDIIMLFEGFEEKAYKCPADVWTIGWGRTENVKQGEVTTKERELPYLKTKTQQIADAIYAAAKKELTQGQLDALVSFAYNVGEAALLKSTLFKKHNEGKFQEAQAEFMKWNKARVKGVLTVLNGLTRRRAHEAAMYGQ